MADATLTWLGHSSFRIDTPGGKRIYVDPWLSGPTCPADEREPERVDLIALTHGHGDHLGESRGRNVPRRARRPRRPTRERILALLRGRHLRLRRHAADRPHLPPGRR